MNKRNFIYERTIIMDKAQAKQRIEKLKKEIEHYRYLYHVLDRQEISDGALDSLKNELFKLEMEYPELITPDSPTQRIGGRPLDKFAKTRHSSPMMSLFDAFSENDMAEWEKRMRKILSESGIGNQEFGNRKLPPPNSPSFVPQSGTTAGKQFQGPNFQLDYYCELKMDGLAVSLIYQGGALIRGATRGNGLVGEDVTNNLRTIESIPLKLRLPSRQELQNIGIEPERVLGALESGTVELRGEAIMSLKTFKELNEKYKKEGKPQLANPRNGAAGSIRQLDPKIAAERKLDFYAYSIAADLGFAKHEQEHELAGLLGLKVLKQNKYCQTLDEVLKFHDYWEEHRGKMPFECDGIVVKVNDLSLWPILGVVGKGPRYIMAYKFSAQQATTKVKDVVWQVGRTGILTPTAMLEPVKVGGVTVSRSTIHNMDEIDRLNLKIGDTVIIERAGDVIPKIIQVLPNLRSGKEKKISPPEICPMCSGKVMRLEGEVAYKCVNKDCFAINLRRLIHWASKGAMDIAGLGPKIIEQLVKEGLIRDISDFYNLTAGDLKPLERFADKSAENLVRSIDEKKENELGKVIYGLGIQHVGEETAITLSSKFNPPAGGQSSKLIDFFDLIITKSIDDLQNIEDIGPVVAKSIFDWFHNKKNQELLHKLEKSGLKLRMEKEKERILEGKSFVLTGGLKGLTRDEAKAKIRELGGDVSASVSKNTDYVVAGSEPGSKYEKAKELGVKIVSEEEFLFLINSKPAK